MLTMREARRRSREIIEGMPVWPNILVKTDGETWRAYTRTRHSLCQGTSDVGEDEAVESLKMVIRRYGMDKL